MPGVKGEKKSHLGLIIGIISAVVVLSTAAILLIFVFDVFSGKNGTYRLQGAFEGQTMELKADGEKSIFSTNMNGSEQRTDCKVTFDGNKVTVSSHGNTLEGIYDKDTKTITFTREALIRASVLIDRPSGTYKLYSAKAYGLSVAPDQLESYGLDPEEYTMRISGNKATLNMAGNNASGDVSISGNKMTITADGQSIDATFDNDAGTITLSYTGVEMVFKRAEDENAAAASLTLKKED